jgi:uncharacterized repeat protein (TIGR01451 family)
MTLKKALLVSTAALALTSMAAPVFAAGTTANSSITNTISVSYMSDGNAINTPNAASDAFVVDEKINFTLVPQDAPTTVTVQPAEDDAILTFLLTNTGNDARDFDIDVAVTDDGAPLGLTFDPTGSGADGTYSIYTSPIAGTGQDTLYNPAGFVGVGPLGADEAIYVKIIAQIPDDAEQDEDDIFDVTAQPLNAAGTGTQDEAAAFDPTTKEAVYGDAGANGTETAQEQFTVSSAMISATKTVSVVSENRGGTFSCAFEASEGGEAFIPGACVEYTITLTNDANANENADNFSFTDTFPAGVSYSGIVAGNTFDSVVVGATSITGTVNSLAPGASATVSFRAEID